MGIPQAKAELSGTAELRESPLVVTGKLPFPSLSQVSWPGGDTSCFVAPFAAPALPGPCWDEEPQGSSAALGLYLF